MSGFLAYIWYFSGKWASPKKGIILLSFSAKLTNSAAAVAEISIAIISPFLHTLLKKPTVLPSAEPRYSILLSFLNGQFSPLPKTYADNFE